MKSMTVSIGALCLISLMLITAGCTGDVLDNPKQLRLSATSVQQGKEAPSYTDTVTNKLGSYYDRLPDGGNSLFGKDSNVQLKDPKVYHGVYAEDEYRPFTDAEPFALY